MVGTVELSEHKVRVARIYDLAAPGYDKPAVRFFHLVGEQLVKLAQIKPGERVLDVATGTGAAAIPAGQATGPTGHVVGVDLAEEMLAQGRRNIASANLRHVELVRGDAADLAFPDHSFDAVICSSSVFFLPDMVAGLEEWKRVTRVGGRIAFSGFGEGAFEPMSSMFARRIRLYGDILPAGQRPFSWQRLSDPARYISLIHSAGFNDAHVYTAQLGYFLVGVNEWWDVLWNSGFRGPLSRLTPEQLDRFKQEHLAEVEALPTPQGIWLDIPAIFGVSSR